MFWSFLFYFMWSTPENSYSHSSRNVCPSHLDSLQMFLANSSCFYWKQSYCVRKTKLLCRQYCWFTLIWFLASLHRRKWRGKSQYTHKNLYDIAGKITRPVTESFSTDNKQMDDSEKQCINVICITVCNRNFGREVVEFMGLKVSESRSGNDSPLDQQLKTWLPTIR